MNSSGGASVEFKIVGFDSVAEDDAVGGHVGFDGEVVAREDDAGDQIGLRCLAGERLADNEDESGIIPGELEGFFIGGFSEEGADASSHVEDAGEPAGGACARGDEQAAGALRLATFFNGEFVAGGDVSFVADEEFVKGEKFLAVVQLGLGEGNLSKFGFSQQNGADDVAGLVDAEGEEDTVEALRVGIDGDDGPADGVFGSVGDEPVLADSDDDVCGAEEEIGKEVAVDSLDGEIEILEVEIAAEGLDSGVVGLGSGIDVVESGGGGFFHRGSNGCCGGGQLTPFGANDLKLGVRAGTEAAFELRQLGGACDDDNFLIVGLHVKPISCCRSLNHLFFQHRGREERRAGRE